MPTTRYHSIRKLLKDVTWSLVLVGQHKQDWGFLTEDGFILCDDYPAYVDSHA